MFTPIDAIPKRAVEIVRALATGDPTEMAIAQALLLQSETLRCFVQAISSAPIPSPTSIQIEAGYRLAISHFASDVNQQTLLALETKKTLSGQEETLVAELLLGRSALCREHACLVLSNLPVDGHALRTLLEDCLADGDRYVRVAALFAIRNSTGVVPQNKGRLVDKDRFYRLMATTITPLA